MDTYTSLYHHQPSQSALTPPSSTMVHSGAIPECLAPWVILLTGLLSFCKMAMCAIDGIIFRMTDTTIHKRINLLWQIPHTLALHCVTLFHFVFIMYSKYRTQHQKKKQLHILKSFFYFIFMQIGSNPVFMGHFLIY